MFGIYFLALLFLLSGLAIRHVIYEKEMRNKLVISGSIVLMIIAYLLCFFGDRLYLISNLILFTMIIVFVEATKLFIKNSRVFIIICYIFSFCIMAFGQHFQVLPYPTPLGRGNIDQYIESGDGTLEDPYILERANIYSAQFDQIVNNTIKNGEVIETYDQQTHGGYWINTLFNENQEVNFVDIHYLKSFYPDYWYDLKENDKVTEIVKKSYKKNFLFSMLIYIFIIVLNADNSDMVMIGTSMIIFLCGIYALATFSYDEKCNTDKYVLTLGLSRKEVIISKYLLVIFSLFFGAVTGVLLNIILSLFNIVEIINIKDSFASILGIVFALSIIEGIQIPCIYKYGAEKGRLQIYLIAMVIFLIIGVFYLLFPNINLDFLNTIEFIVPYILILLICLNYYISYKISCKIYFKKEL